MAEDNPQTLPEGFPLAGLEVRGLIGAGTFGHVYRCADAGGVLVAVREYLPGAIAVRGTDGAVLPLSASSSAFDAGLARFVGRAESMKGIRHPNVVRVIDVFRANGTAYASMELADGESVAALLGDSGTLAADLLASYFGPVLDGLAAMHAAGVVHGSIGPGSIVVGETRAPVLLGLAVPPSDEFGAVAKPGYAPIEHYSARAHFGGPAADVYAIGAVLYRCMTGVVPPEPPVRVARDALVPAARAARGRYPAKLLQAVDAALAVQPDARPASIDDLRAAVVDTGRDAAAAPARANAGARRQGRGRTPRRGFRRRLATGAAAAVVVAVAGGLVWRQTAPGPALDGPGPDEPPTATTAQDAAEPAVRDQVDAGPTAVADASESPPADEPPALVEAPAEPPPSLTASLVVDTVPPGAEVVVDGVVAGETPLEIADLAPRTLAVSLRHPLYETIALDDVALEAGETTRLSRELVRATGSLRVTASPVAWVALAGRRLADATPATIEDLPAGPATVTLGADGHDASDVDVVIPAGGVAELEFALARAFGTLTLALAPVDAEVTLLDADAAYAPGVRLPIGAHRIRVARDGFETLERTVDVAGDAEFRIELAPQTYPFTVVTRPPGATIRFVDPGIAYAPGVSLRPGTYEVGTTLRGYAPWDGRVNHGAAPTMYAVALEFVSEFYADPMGSGGAGPEMVVVPAGSFRMGCGRATGCTPAELPVRTVAFEMPFSVSKHEVTFEEFDRFADATGLPRPDAAGWGRGRRPAINVSWDDAVAYAAWLSSETGRHYALPSEAEWEYAARAGTETAFAWGDAVGDSANCSDCGIGRSRTIPVGSFPANGWGLHDMHGNVWEWVQDCWNDGYADAPADGGPWLEGDCGRRMLRGGSWFNGGAFARSASRLSGEAAVRGNIAGFRVTARDRRPDRALP
ncbi:MAG: SUMF1/EgtB/PvdO family nonheme iron enzyme [Gammaproteobacteria bacterium]|nr:SUMF1/EgtB/PvdO family nonheme iron enzyme [Gammaproteobacteria bacterium]